MARQTAKSNKTKSKAGKGRGRTAGQAAKRSSKTMRAHKRTTTTRTATTRRHARMSHSRKPAARSHAADAIALLKQDHRQLLPLLAELKEAPAARRERLLEQAQEMLRHHTTIEEEIFYPAYRDMADNEKDRKMYQEALEEHHAVDVILGEVSSARREDEVFAGRAKVLKDLVEHHVEEEEGEMFPHARELFPAGELKRLAEEMQARKRTLAQRGTGPLSAVTSLFSR